MMQYVISLLALAYCACTDLRSRKIDRRVVLLYLFLAVVLHLSAQTDAGTLLAGAVPGLVCLALSFLTREAIGYGDSVLMIVCGISLGPARCMELLTAAFFLSGIWAVLLWRFRRADRKKEFAFVPFLLAGLLLQLSAAAGK